jgi:hypothetical protein
MKKILRFQHQCRRLFSAGNHPFAPPTVNKQRYVAMLRHSFAAGTHVDLLTQQTADICRKFRQKGEKK